MDTVRHLLRLLALCTALLVAAAPAAAQDEPPAAESGANGNVFTGGLSFTPADLTVPVGGVAAWRNTDFLVPHTVTERHRLWDLTGGYGATPVNPPGFGPGEVVKRKFEAGTHAYFCDVHPEDMTGTVAVPVSASVTRTTVRRRGRRARTVATVALRWAADAPADGLAFDVHRRVPGGEWGPLATATTATDGTFRTSPGRTWELRARLRSAKDASAATGWSPVVGVTG